MSNDDIVPIRRPEIIATVGGVLAPETVALVGIVGAPLLFDMYFCCEGEDLR